MSMTCNQAVLPLLRCHGEGNHLAIILLHSLQANDVHILSTCATPSTILLTPFCNVSLSTPGLLHISNFPALMKEDI